MKLRNKKTGEIIDSKELLTDKFMIDLFGKDFKYFASQLDKIQEEWEDYEEPKEYWFVSEFGKVYSLKNIPMDKERIGWLTEIGNYFESKEEAERAVENLKAWKRLKDKGFRFDSYHIPAGEIFFNMEIPRDGLDEFVKDIDLLFGGEE